MSSVWSKRVALVVALGCSLSTAALADSKADARRYFNQGMAAIDAGRPLDGIALLKRAYAIRPHPNVLFNIARAYASAGDLDAAIDFFERYLASGPRDAAAVRSTLEDLQKRRRLRRVVSRGMAAIRAGRYLDGVASLTRAYEIEPNPSLLFNIGRAYEDAGQPASAIAYFRRYLSTRPADAAAVRRRIEALSAPPKPSPRARERAAPQRPSEPERAPARARASEPAELREDQVATIADAVVERLKRLPAFRAAPPTEPPVEPPPEALPGSEASLEEDGLAPVALADEAAASVALEAKSGEAYEDVVVTASRRAQSPLDAPNAVTIVTAEDIRLSGARTIPDLLRRVPGMDVMAMSYSDYNVAARGFNRRLANKLLVLIDGQTAYIDFLGYTSWRTLGVELMDIDRIEVVRGPGSAVYGAYAYTGVVNIITKRPADLNGATAEIAAGNGEVLEGSFQYGKRSGQLGFRFSGGYQQGQKYEIDFDTSQPNVSTDLDDPERSLQLGRFSGRVEYELGGQSPAALFLAGSVVVADQEIFGVADQRNLYAQGPETYLKGGFESELFSLRAFWSRVQKDTLNQAYFTGGSALPTAPLQDLVSVEPILRPSFDFLGRHRMVVGGEYRFKAIEWDYLNGDQTEDHFAAYFQDDWRLSEGFAIVTSGRLDLHPLIGPLGSPRVAFVLKPSPRQALRLSLGTAFRVPTMAETYLELSSQVPQNPGTAVTLVGGGDRLDPEQIATADLGYRLESDVGAFELVGYFNRVTDLIVRSRLEPTGIDARLLPRLGALEVARSLYTNDEDAFLAVGAELGGRLYPFDGFDVGTSYSFQYIWNERTGDQLTDAPMHKFSLWGQFRTELGLDVSAEGHFVSDQAWVEASFDPDRPSGFDTTPLPLDANLTLLARVGYRLLDDRLELAVSGFNLLDAGGARQRQHPFGNRLEARILGSVRGRF